MPNNYYVVEADWAWFYEHLQESTTVDKYWINQDVVITHWTNRNRRFTGLYVVSIVWDVRSSNHIGLDCI